MNKALKIKKIFLTYCFVRNQNPGVPYEKWSRYFPDIDSLETTYQKQYFLYHCLSLMKEPVKLPPIKTNKTARILFITIFAISLLGYCYNTSYFFSLLLMTECFIYIGWFMVKYRLPIPVVDLIIKRDGISMDNYKNFFK